jgi:two-component system sensor histidine kinase KdpD
MARKALQRTARLAGTLAAVGAVTVVLVRLTHVNPTTAGFLYLITVLVIAAAWGFVEAVAASIVATLCFNFFFFPPVGTFTIAEPHNWVALFAFLATALIASQLSERARRRTQEAVRQQAEMERLYALSRAILLTRSDQPFGQQIAQEIARIYECSAAAIFDRSDGTLHSAGTFELPDVAQKLQDAAAKATLADHAPSGTTIASVRLRGQPVGSLALQKAKLSETGLQALLNLVAIGLERFRAQEAAARAEAARESEAFKSTLLDALAHEFKTPLTSIKAATSAILSNGVPQAEQQSELLTVIDQEASRLSALMTESIHLARIEAGKILLDRQPHPVRELIEQVVRQLEIALEGRAVRLAVEDPLPLVSVDAELVVLALKQLMDNAAKYSPPNSPVSIEARVAGDAVAIRVRNEGAGIPEQERPRIFERFYRGQEARRQISGSGMGLAIAQEILQAHGGAVRLETSPGQGAEFIAVLPLSGKGPAG